jgi:cyclic pyranopterin phosphate synthase
MHPIHLFNEVRLKLDHGCNFRCFYCSSWQPREPQLDAVAICSLLRTLPSFGARKLVISGGEPLTHPAIERILLGARQLFPRISITTNGTGLAQRAGELAALNVAEIHLSVDRLGNEIRYSGEGNSNQAELSRALRAATAAGLSVTLNYIVLRGMNDSRAALTAMIKFAQDQGCAIGLLDVLSDARSSLNQFRKSYAEIRRDLEEWFGVSGRSVEQENGMPRTLYALGGVEVTLRDYRLCVSGVCPFCNRHVEYSHGITGPQIYSSGSLSLCFGSRIGISSSAELPDVVFCRWAEALASMSEIAPERI